MNSFYEQTENRERHLSDLRALLAGLPPRGMPVVFVTHYVTVLAMTNEVVGEGEGVLARRLADGSLEAVEVVELRGG